MDVDEAGCQGQPVAGDRVVGVTLRAVADEDDAAVGEGNVGSERGVAASVVDVGIPENCL